MNGLRNVVRIDKSYLSNKTFMEAMRSVYNKGLIPEIGYINISFNDFINTWIRIVSSRQMNFNKSIRGIPYELSRSIQQNEANIHKSV